MNSNELWKQVKEYKLPDGDSAAEKFAGYNYNVENLRTHFNGYMEDCTIDDSNIINIVSGFMMYMLGYNRGVSDTEDVLGNSND